MGGVLEGKRALVTGGHRGLGRGIAEAFVAAGAATAIADIQGAEATAREIGQGTVGVACDVRSAESVTGAIAETTRAHGGLDILVNNAGVECLAPLHELSEDEFDRMVSVNLRGTWLVYKHALSRRRRGVVRQRHRHRRRRGNEPSTGVRFQEARRAIHAAT
jgi:NAD(P)-dependent dehydrogenase (short-subunit alcohol dehydrogenase family)